jgi:phosphate-selective porin OprO/OprP
MVRLSVSSSRPVAIDGVQVVRMLNLIWKLRLRLIVVVLLVFGLAQAQEASEPRDVLIRNATLLDPAGTGADRMVSLLVRNGKLELVTEDAISGEGVDEVVNANAGFIVGNLEIGAPPNFMVLIDDPRKNFQLLLDTKKYASFAMHDGRVVKNTLVQVLEPEEEVAPERPSRESGWLAYTPPPLAVPLSYSDTSKWNRFESRYVSGLFTAGLVADRMNWSSQDADSATQVGDLSNFEGGEIRGLRFGVIGTLNMFDEPWVYTIFGATNAFDKGFNEDGLDDFSWFDWRVDVPFIADTVLSIGKQKEPISGERVQSMLGNHMQERSAAADAMLPSRNVGIVWNGSRPSRYTTWAVGVFNDWIEANQDLDESATQYIGRVTWAPLRTDDDSSLLHVGLGYRYSNAKEGFRFRTEPEFNQAPLYVDTGFDVPTGVLPADNLQTWNAELSWRRGPLWLASEYTRTSVDNTDLANPSFDGYWIGASWVLTGEMRPYNKKSGTFGSVPIARTVYQGGKGAWELSARWSSIDLSDGLVEGGEMDIASLGVSWWLTPFFSVGMDYRYIWNTRLGEEGTSSGLNSRILLLLE